MKKLADFRADFLPQLHLEFSAGLVDSILAVDAEDWTLNSNFGLRGSPTELSSKERSNPNSQIGQTEGCEVKLEITSNVKSQRKGSKK
jgi:hypothetical protein